MPEQNAYQSSSGQQYGQYNQYAQPGEVQQSNDPRNEMRNYQFSPDEIRVLKECQSESFYYRSLPFSLSFGTTAYLAVKNGYLKPNSMLGPWPKVLALGFFGYIAGRLSYTEQCKAKILALPNSKFAEMLRKNQRGGKNWDMGTHEATALSLAPFKSASSGSYSDDYNQSNSLNLDTSRPNYSGLDDVFQPTMEGNNDLNEELAIPTRKNTITYDELRQQNRNEYARAHNQPASPPPNAYYNQGNAPPPSPSHGPLNPPAGSYSQVLDIDRRRIARNKSDDDASMSTTNQQTGPKNKYGDTWSE